MSGDQLTILAVDDERTQLEDLARLLRNSPSVKEVECAYDGHDALVKASTQAFDAIFLDVRMPNLDGLELGRVLRRFAAPPQLVFVSAYDNAAVDAFELHALDYLRKPVGRRRVEEAIERVATAVESSSGVTRPRPPGAASSPPVGGRGTGGADSEDHEMIAVANLHGGSTRLLARRQILYVQSYGDFVRIVTADGRYLLRSTLAEIERRWEPHGFVRVHRQYVANLRNAVELAPMLGGTAELTFADSQTIPVARRHTTELGRRLSV
ncbi:MAG TPA: LytTR family DNA-binding domain-containing protein [Solirubrobacteraceae bacterium]|nr:LytTR family DNA-binding domain-containing protein [Solirubrobacteraceae bacterium]